MSCMKINIKNKKIKKNSGYYYNFDLHECKVLAENIII